jgi:hypothetical protein
MATGGTSHALGTASVTASEPKIAPPSAVTFLVTGWFFLLLIIIWYLLHVLCGRSLLARFREVLLTMQVRFRGLCVAVFVGLSTCLSACPHDTPPPPPFRCLCVRVLLAGAMAHAFLFHYFFTCLVLFVQARFCVLSSSCMPFAHSSSSSLVNCAITKLAGDALEPPLLEYLS